jgi:hypothetical protein
MRRRSGPTADTQRRISAIYDSLKKSGRRGVFLSELIERANERLDEGQKVRSLSHLHFLLFGWPARDRQAEVGGYLHTAIEPVPGTPQNVRYIRLRAGVRKREALGRSQVCKNTHRAH